MSSFVDIADSDYQQRRHASELAAWVNTKFREIEAGGRLEEQYFERRGLNVKRLLEEAVPLSRLGLHLWTPGNEPYLTMLPAARNVDGEVEVQGFSARSFKVEVTPIETDESTMRRQALAREGTVQLLGPIRKRGRTIIAEPEMVDVAEQMARVTELTMERLREKVESRAYDDTTAMLVYLSEFWPLPYEGRLPPQAHRKLFGKGAGKHAYCVLLLLAGLLGGGSRASAATPSFARSRLTRACSRQAGPASAPFGRRTS